LNDLVAFSALSPRATLPSPFSSVADLALEAESESEDESSASPLLNFRFFSGGILTRPGFVLQIPDRCGQDATAAREKRSGGRQDFELPRKQRSLIGRWILEILQLHHFYFIVHHSNNNTSTYQYGQTTNEKADSCPGQ
jgi:hypothetical protein